MGREASLRGLRAERSHAGMGVMFDQVVHACRLLDRTALPALRMILIINNKCKSLSKERKRRKGVSSLASVRGSYLSAYVALMLEAHANKK